MSSNPRRNFLMGRRPVRSPWETFCRDLKRRAAGELFDFGFRDGSGSARLIPANGADVRHARALCAEHRVTLALDGVPGADPLYDHSVLWVDPAPGLGGCEAMPDEHGKWFVRPGCLLSELAEAGLEQFQSMPGYLTVAAWLADRSLCNWPSGQTRHSGLLHAAVLLADGSLATLGPFGQGNRQALNTLTLQTMIPGLFNLIHGAAGQSCRSRHDWPARYRLDALAPVSEGDANLAHLMLGHGGDLAWVEWLVFANVAPADAPDWQAHAFSTRNASDTDPGWISAMDLDAHVKSLFDPAGLFPHPGQDL